MPLYVYNKFVNYLLITETEIGSFKLVKRYDGDN